MLDSWENIVLIIKNPWFIALILTAISLESLIKFMRRFYTKKQRREIKEFNEFQKFIAENGECRRVYKKANLRIVLFISSPLILGVVFLSLYAIFISGEFNMVCFGDKLIHFGTLFITPFRRKAPAFRHGDIRRSCALALSLRKDFWEFISLENLL